MSIADRTEKLFQPFLLGRLALSNRAVMAPMSRTRAESDGTPSALMETYYAQRAGAGLIIAEASTPNRVGQTYPNIPGLHSPRQVAGWQRVTSAVAAAGGHMFAQIEHGGRVGHPATSGLVPLAPSAVPMPGLIHTPGGKLPTVTPRVMSTADIRATTRDFVAAARNAIAAGFDGVEVHAANGYLLHQFLASNTNQRRDAYGGSPARRIRIVVEVVEAVVDAIGAERVGVRISPGVTSNGIVEEDSDQVYPLLVSQLGRIANLAYLHQVFTDPGDRLHRRIRDLWPGIFIGNPLLPWPGPLPVDGGLSAAADLLDAGADLVSFGRSFLANPDLVVRLQQGAPLNPLRAEFEYGDGPIGYVDYPSLEPSRTVAA